MRTMEALFRARTRRRPPDFAPSSETPGGYVGQAVPEAVKFVERCWRLCPGGTR
jgi:hypothetical protein